MHREAKGSPGAGETEARAKRGEKGSAKDWRSKRDAPCEALNTVPSSRETPLNADGDAVVVSEGSREEEREEEREQKDGLAPPECASYAPGTR